MFYIVYFTNWRGYDNLMVEFFINFGKRIN